MDKRQFTTTALSTAMGLAIGMLGVTASAQDMKDMSKRPPMVKENMKKRVL